MIQIVLVCLTSGKVMTKVDSLFQINGNTTPMHSDYATYSAKKLLNIIFHVPLSVKLTGLESCVSTT